MTAPARRKVLVVEDEEIIREWLHECFTLMHWEIKAAEDGRQALEILCHDTDFDLVLLDVWLPDMNGLEMLRTLRGLGVPSPVILMTAYGESFDREHALQLGAVEVLLKPFEVNQLEERIQELVV